MRAPTRLLRPCLTLAAGRWAPLLVLSCIACGGSGGSSSESRVDEGGDLLVDDLEDGDDEFTLRGVQGEWFTYSDETADVVPPSHMGVGDTPGELHVTGDGFSEWGVAVAAYFQYSDLSEFAGVKVRIKGSGQVRFELSTADTLPLDHDGTCVTGCYGHYATLVDLPADYEDVTILFADLAQPGWASAAELSLERAGQVDFLAPGSAAAPATIDLWIDQLSLVPANPLD